MKNPEEIDPDWGRYAETILMFSEQPGMKIDLRETLSSQARSYFESIGFPQTFAILTAHDPLGHDLTPDENRQRQMKLEAELTAAKIHFVRVDACSTDREHCECSLAIDVDQAQALGIAKAYEQMAIFWYDGEAVWLLGAMVKSDPIRLPRTA